MKNKLCMMLLTLSIHAGALYGLDNPRWEKLVKQYEEMTTSQKESVRLKGLGEFMASEAELRTFYVKYADIVVETQAAIRLRIESLLKAGDPDPTRVKAITSITFRDVRDDAPAYGKEIAFIRPGAEAYVAEATYSDGSKVSLGVFLIISDTPKHCLAFGCVQTHPGTTE